MLKLNKYLDNPKMIYDYANALLHIKKSNNKGLTFEKMLHELAIEYSSYRRDKCNNILTDNCNVDIIYSHFKQSRKISNVLKEKYEYCIKKIYYNSYFRTIDKIKPYLDMVEEYIEHNNYFKPILILFKILGYMNLPYPIDQLRKLLIDELDYLYYFKTSYFEDEYKLLYLSIMHYFDYNTDNRIKNSLLKKHKEYSWIYYNTLASNYYKNKEFDKALTNYNMVLEIYTEAKNLERQIITVSNIACIYNLLEQYDATIRALGDAINYAYSEDNSIWIKNIIQHYVHASFMLEEYNNILFLVSDEIFDITKLNSPSAVICIYVFYLNGIYNKSQEIINYFNKDLNVSCICEYINTSDITYLRQLEDVKVFNDLKENIITKLNK